MFYLETSLEVRTRIFLYCLFIFRNTRFFYLILFIFFTKVPILPSPLLNWTDYGGMHYKICTWTLAWTTTMLYITKHTMKGHGQDEPQNNYWNTCWKEHDIFHSYVPVYNKLQTTPYIFKRVKTFLKVLTETIACILNIWVQSFIYLLITIIFFFPKSM